MLLVLMTISWQSYLGLFRWALLGRATIYVLICWNMYAGRRWARTGFVILMVIAGGNSAWVSFNYPDQVLYVVIYAALAGIVAFNRNVRAFFRFTPTATAHDA